MPESLSHGAATSRDPHELELARIVLELEAMTADTDELRKRRDVLIREHPGTLREIAETAGVSHETVRKIKYGEQR